MTHLIVSTKPNKNRLIDPACGHSTNGTPDALEGIADNGAFTP